MQMRFGFTLAVLVLGVHGTEPISLHAANAAEAASVAHQAAKVATRAALHSAEVASDTAAALRYTQDALKGAGANSEDIARVGKEADTFEQERQSSTGSSNRKSSRMQENSDSHINRDNNEGGRGGSTASSSGESAGTDGSTASSETSQSGGIGGSNGGNGGSGGNGGGGDSPRGLDVNSQIVPYPSGVEPFGQEEPAKELTEESVKQSDGMVDQIENAQGTEAKRSVYRALTKLRGATIASYDGIAKGHLKNVDSYNSKHKWRDLHPMKHLAEEESDTHIWAFPKRSSKTAPAKKKGAAPAPASAAPSPAAAK